MAENEEKKGGKIEDAGWKAEAKKEKEALEKDVEDGHRHAPLPPANFTNHITQLGTQAFIFLGVIKNPLTGEETRDIEQAKYVIDVLEMLKKKTAGNLEKAEEKLLESLLFDLRMKYVAASGIPEGNQRKG